MYIQLKDFKEGRRSDPAMSPMAADLSRDDMIALGNFFAAQKPRADRVQGRRRQGRSGAEDLGRGAVPDVPPGRLRRPERDSTGCRPVPRVHQKQLQDFKAKRRTNDAGNMTSVAGTLSDADIENLAHYIANLN